MSRLLDTLIAEIHASEKIGLINEGEDIKYTSARLIVDILVHIRESLAEANALSAAVEKQVFLWTEQRMHLDSEEWQRLIQANNAFRLSLVPLEEL